MLCITVGRPPLSQGVLDPSMLLQSGILSKTFSGELKWFSSSHFFLKV